MTQNKFLSKNGRNCTEIWKSKYGICQLLCFKGNCCGTIYKNLGIQEFRAPKSGPLAIIARRGPS